MEKENKDTKYWRQMYFKCKGAEENQINDSHFYKIALNLSKNREALEVKAVELIDKYGYIKALKKSGN